MPLPGVTEQVGMPEMVLASECNEFNQSVIPEVDILYIGSPICGKHRR